ncbi:MAG: ROK family protein [Promethearchaeota archaeon]
MEEKIIIGVDIGGTWIRVGLSTINLKKEEIISKKIKTPKETQYSISNAVCHLINEILNEKGFSKEDISGIGLASAGPLDMDKGEVFNNANLGFKVIPLKEPIQKEFPNVPIYLINDCNAAVLAVHYFEALDDEKDNLIYVTMSTGIGGGVICNGRLLLGKEGNAAEVGHGIVEPKSKFQCNCGAYGCWEVYSSGTGVRLRTLKTIEENNFNYEILKKIVNNDLSKITAKEVFQAARKGDELSKKIVNECIFYTKVGIGLINNFYDISCIYFGGAMLNDEDMIIPPLIEQFEKDPITFTINHPPKIKKTTLEDEVGLLGALALVKYKLENNNIVS